MGETRQRSAGDIRWVSFSTPLSASRAIIELGGSSQTMNGRPVLGIVEQALNVALWVSSDFSAFSQFQSVLDVNAQVAHRTVDLGVPEKDLNRAKVACRFVDDRRFRASKRVRHLLRINDL